MLSCDRPPQGRTRSPRPASLVRARRAPRDGLTRRATRPPSPPGSAGTAVSANAASGNERDNARAPSATVGAGQSPHRAQRAGPWPPTPNDSATSPAASLGSTASSPAAVQTGNRAVSRNRPPPPTAPPQALPSGAHPPVTSPGPANLSDRLPDQPTAHEAFPALRSSDQTQTLPACNPAPASGCAMRPSASTSMPGRPGRSAAAPAAIPAASRVSTPTSSSP